MHLNVQFLVFMIKRRSKNATEKETQEQHNARFSVVNERENIRRETHTTVGNLFGVNAHKRTSVLNCILRRLIGTSQVSPFCDHDEERVSKQLIKGLPSAISFNVWREFHANVNFYANK